MRAAQLLRVPLFDVAFVAGTSLFTSVGRQPDTKCTNVARKRSFRVRGDRHRRRTIPAAGVASRRRALSVEYQTNGSNTATTLPTGRKYSIRKNVPLLLGDAWWSTRSTLVLSVTVRSLRAASALSRSFVAFDTKSLLCGTASNPTFTTPNLAEAFCKNQSQSERPAYTYCTEAPKKCDIETKCFFAVPVK